MKQYARFATAPIGPQLAARDGGLTLTTIATPGLGTARSDVAHNAGTHGAEFTFWGDAAPVCTVGVIQPADGLTVLLGATANSVGWRIDLGQVFINGAVVASGLPVVAKGEIVGVRVLLDGGGPTIEFYRGAVLVHSRALAAGGTWHFAASMSAAVAGTLSCAVNAGQWQGVSAAVLAGGWLPSPAVVTTVRISDLDWLSAATDSPANARFEGVIDQSGMTTVAALGFWPWGGDAPMQGGAAQVSLLDAEGLLDALAQQDVSGVPVAVQMVDADGGGPRTNLVVRSSEVDTASWGKSQMATTIGNATTDPTGALTAEKIIPNAVSSQHYCEPNQQTFADNTIVAVSAYVKKAELDRVRINYVTKGGSGPTLEFRFSTKSMTVQSMAGGGAAVTFAFDELADGWFRLRMGNINVGTGAVPPRFRYVLVDDAGAATFVGDGIKGVYVWGAQVEVGADVTPYIVTGAAAVTVPGTNTLAGATKVGRFVCDRIEMHDDARKTIHLRDAHDDLDEPLNRGVFLPNIIALAWRVQPTVIGAVASIPALPANSDGSVAWLADSPLFEVAAVLDRGDAMEAGTWILTPDKQQLYLQQPPVGPVVVDASSIGAAMQPATLQQALAELFRRIGKAAWSSADAAAIDAATGYAGIGYHAGEVVTVRQALAAILPSYGAWWWQDSDGVLRFFRVVDPASVAPGALAFDLEYAKPGQPKVYPDAYDLNADLVTLHDDAPRLSRRMAYRPNARVLTAAELVTDLVDVPVWRRDELTSPWRGQAYSAQSLAARYAHADTNAPMVSCFYRSQDAQTEIDRVCALYAVVRRFFRVQLHERSLAPKPGQVGRITYPRYGLDAGKQVLVRSVERNPATGEVVLTLWG